MGVFNGTLERKKETHNIQVTVSFIKFHVEM